MDRDFEQLRQKFDSNDPFMSSGHQIIKSAGATRHANRLLKIPVWALDDGKIRQLIESRFPNAKIDRKQRARAARMVRIIYLYYRVGQTNADIAEELKMSLNAVDCALRRINKAMSGPLKPAHRLKKSDSIQTPSGTSGDDGHIAL